MALRLTAREFDRALRKHGCEIVRHKGGHAIYKTPSGRTVVNTAAGRKTRPPADAAKRAAVALGITVEELLS